MPISEEQLLLAAIAAIVVFTGGLGIGLALTARAFGAQVQRGTAAAPAAKDAAATRVKVTATARPRRTTAAAPTRPAQAGLGLVIFVLVILAAGVAVGRFARLMPISASSEAADIDLLFNAMLGISVVIFLLVEGLLVYLVLRFRRRRGDESDGLPIHGSNRLEVAWTIIPAVIVTWLGIFSFQVLDRLQAPRPEAMTVEVTGQQFQWRYHYPDSGVTSSDLHVPLGRPIRLKISSEDVIHAFWVPEFRIKQDAMPMRETNTYFTATRIGEYQVVCAELCGSGHSRMGLVSRAIVQSQADFDEWVAQQTGAGPSDQAIAGNAP